ncbi:hypothetical protein QVD17_01588 [Tagetes erecta]|uniref:Uncharacterized protein n=1 Tax=Tagetes erecta TaxID=13708 RepID=A0AAD8L7S1_TARER|nr:hypothetical protein QVD17_01588 [Tagetes erecta]
MERVICFQHLISECKVVCLIKAFIEIEIRVPPYSSMAALSMLVVRLRTSVIAIDKIRLGAINIVLPRCCRQQAFQGLKS